MASPATAHALRVIMDDFKPSAEAEELRKAAAAHPHVKTLIGLRERKATLIAQYLEAAKAGSGIEHASAWKQEAAVIDDMAKTLEQNIMASPEADKLNKQLRAEQLDHITKALTEMMAEKE